MYVYEYEIVFTEISVIFVFLTFDPATLRPLAENRTEVRNSTLPASTPASSLDPKRIDKSTNDRMIYGQIREDKFDSRTTRTCVYERGEGGS